MRPGHRSVRPPGSPPPSRWGRRCEQPQPLVLWVYDGNPGLYVQINSIDNLPATTKARTPRKAAKKKATND